MGAIFHMCFSSDAGIENVGPKRLIPRTPIPIQSVPAVWNRPSRSTYQGSGFKYVGDIEWEILPYGIQDIVGSLFLKYTCRWKVYSVPIRIPREQMHVEPAGHV